MKTLTLILLIFCINMQGQDLKLNYGHTDVDFHSVWLNTLLNEYSQYEKECYNDSVFIRINTRCLDSIIIYHDIRIVKEKYRHVIKEDTCYYLGSWEPRIKPDLDKHFIAWLRKKYNQ